ncbi:J domain-containing protein [Aliarcobacter butzleri]|uniref:J domain-containing protein n=1 Tax=Aliarcobacter butzleri TaxID=28197 RepID=UPI001EDC21B9|nr:J domain-containing protein [Aliarcobacter butzleri]MCG3687535.1 J domain-containing protein [Aliarcobacter butzleri]
MNREEILKEFKGIEGINEAKKIYKTLAKKLHPDMEGGSEEAFKILNAVYTDLIEHKIYFSNDFKIDIELEKIISLILHFENITIELVGSWVWVSGDTKEIKEKLKELGFKWASKKKMWYYGEMKSKNPTPKSMEEIKSKYGSETLKSNEKKQIAS